MTFLRIIKGDKRSFCILALVLYKLNELILQFSTIIHLFNIFPPVYTLQKPIASELLEHLVACGILREQTEKIQCITDH